MICNKVFPASDQTYHDEVDFTKNTKGLNYSKSLFIFICFLDLRYILRATFERLITPNVASGQFLIADSHTCILRQHNVYFLFSNLFHGSEKCQLVPQYCLKDRNG